jgi:hypothetical protein
VRRTVAWLVAVSERIPRSALELSPGEWANSPEINAIFATPEDISRVLGQSEDLRRYFHAHGDAAAYAWLGAERQERRVLGVEMSGDVLRQEVPRINVSFANPRVVFPAVTVQDARIELGMAIFRGLLAVAMQRIETAQARTKNLGEQKAIMQIRLRRLKSRSADINALAGADATMTLEIEEAERALKQAVAELSTAKASTLGLEAWLAEVQGVLDRPEEIVMFEQVPVRVNRMGVRVEGTATGPINEFTATEIRRPPDFSRIVVLVHCARSDLPAKETLFPH